MATITSAGIGSGLDIERLVTQLVAAERQPTDARLNRSEARLQAQLSAFGTFKGALSSFQSAVSGLTSASAFWSKAATSSNTSAFTATASSTAADGSYNISVSSLAASHTLATAAFGSKTAVVGTGTLTFKFGTTDYVKATDTYNSFTQNADKATQVVTIASTNNSLEGIKDAVNSADIGVSASIVNDGSGYRLVFASSDTGAANSLQVTVDEGTGVPADNTDTVGLSQLAFNADATNLEQTTAAADAALTINGIDISSASNTITEAIEDATLNLIEAGSGTLTVSTNTGAASSAVDSFVSAYNSFINSVDSVSSYDANSGQAGILLGNATVRSITSQVRNIVSASVSGLTGSYNSLASIGVTTDPTTGKLKTDSAKLQQALSSDFESVAKLFAATGTPSDSLIDYVSSTSATEAGTYGVAVSQLATQGDLVGSAAANLTISSGVNDTLEMTIDGVSATVTLSAGTYTADALAAEVQSRVNGASEFANAGISVAVTQSGGVLTITSDRYGSSSAVDITGGNGKTDLVGAASTSTAGVNAAGTIGGAGATGSERYLTGTGDAAGLKLQVTGGGIGDRGTVVFARGYADQLNSLLSTLLDTDKIIDARTEGIQNRIDDITDQREGLDTRMVTLEARYRAQFTALDMLVAQMNTTSDFLTQQLKSLPGAWSSRNDR